MANNTRASTTGTEGYSPEALRYLSPAANRLAASRTGVGDDFQIFAPYSSGGSAWTGRNTVYKVFDPYGNWTGQYTTVGDQGIRGGLLSAAEAAALMGAVAYGGNALVDAFGGAGAGAGAGGTGSLEALGPVESPTIPNMPAGPGPGVSPALGTGAGAVGSASAGDLAAMDAVYGGATPAGGWGTGTLAGGGAGAGVGTGAGAAGAGAGMTTAEQIAMMAANGMTDAEIAAAMSAGGNAAAATSLTGAGFGTGAPAGGGGWLSSLTGGAGGWEKALPFLGSAALNAYSANKAAGTQADAARYAADLQQQMFNKQIELQEPWRQAGINALAKMGTGFTGQVDMTQDPGYAFRLAEGLKALDRQASARGGLLSGAALKGTQRYAQDYASQEYQNAFNRELAKYNTTAALAGVGQTSANALTGAAGTYGANAAEAAMQGANARASGYVNMASALTNAMNQYTQYGQSQQQLANQTAFINALRSSDIRLKTNIVKLGVRADGLGVYAFDYVWGGPRNIGLMAQEVMHVYPDAVMTDGQGYLMVDYAKV